MIYREQTQLKVVRCVGCVRCELLQKSLVSLLHEQGKVSQKDNDVV